MLVRTYAGEESGSDIVRVQIVEVLGHVHLTEYREQPLLLDEVVDLVVGHYRKHIRTLEVVKVVSANEDDDGAFRDEDHVPADGKETEPVHPTSGK